MLLHSFLSTICILLLVTVSSPAVAAVIHVDLQATGSATGQSWEDAFVDLQTALDAAGAADELWVATGTYAHPVSAARTEIFSIRASVSVYGGFAGTETAREQRDFAAFPVILSGELGVAADPTDNTYHVVEMFYNAVLDGVTVTGGYADGGSTTFPDGGGIYVHHSAGTVEIRNCRFEGNWASGGFGGGILIKLNTSARIEDCHFEDNHTVGRNTSGGAIAHGGAAAEIFRCSFIANTSVNSGGAITLFDAAATMTLEDCHFEDNFTEGSGAALWGGTQVTRTQFLRNRGGWGGAVVSSGTFVDCQFIENEGSSGGALRGTANFVRCLFLRNTATNNHGAVAVGSSIGSTFESCVFAFNHAAREGGAVGGLGATLVNSTLYGNSAGLRFGAIRGTTTMENTIMWANSAPGDTILVSPTGWSFAHSIVEGSGGSGPGWNQDMGTDLGGNIDADPQFIDPAALDLRINATSPAFDAGDDTLVLGPFDFSGAARIANARVDIGAYEAPWLTATPALARGRELTAHPNPFNPRTTLRFGVSRLQHVELIVADVRGRRVATLWSEPANGTVEVPWDGTDSAGRQLASGVYYVRLSSADGMATIKVVLLK